MEFISHFAKNAKATRPMYCSFILHIKGFQVLARALSCESYPKDQRSPYHQLAPLTRSLWVPQAHACQTRKPATSKGKAYRQIRGNFSS